MNTFANNLVKFRTDRGWTQDMLAKFSGVSAATICHYECSRRSPGLGNLGKLAKALEVSTDQLLKK